MYYKTSLLSKFLKTDVVGLGCRIKANCPHVGPGPTAVVGVRSRQIFLRNPSPYLCEYRRKPPDVIGVVYKLQNRFSNADSKHKLYKNNHCNINLFQL